MQPKREAGETLGTQTSQASRASTLGQEKGMNAASGLAELDPSARRGEIEKVEGSEPEKILEAGDTGWAAHLANEVADKCFISNAQLLRRLMAAERALTRISKVVVPMNTEVTKVGDASVGILPLPGLASTSAPRVSRSIARWHPTTRTRIGRRTAGSTSC